jgi:hypothetical protein
MVADLAEFKTPVPTSTTVPIDDDATTQAFEEPPPYAEPRDLQEWETVSSTKRKAKDSLKIPANAIRKAPEFRSPKKPLLSARDLALGVAGQDE